MGEYLKFRGYFITTSLIRKTHGASPSVIGVAHCINKGMLCPRSNYVYHSSEEVLINRSKLTDVHIPQTMKMKEGSS
jgi:hypothetical protein